MGPDDKAAPCLGWTEGENVGSRDDDDDDDGVGDSTNFSFNCPNFFCSPERKKNPFCDRRIVLSSQKMIEKVSIVFVSTSLDHETLLDPKFRNSSE